MSKTTTTYEFQGYPILFEDSQGVARFGPWSTFTFESVDKCREEISKLKVAWKEKNPDKYYQDWYKQNPGMHDIVRVDRTPVE